jgi:hypothetical protein
MFVGRIVLASALAAAAVTAVKADDHRLNLRANIFEFGATCNGHHDDTVAFTRAIARVSAGGAIHVPVGQCIVSQTLVIDKPVTIVGSGFGSQIYGKADRTLFRLVNVNNAAIRDVYLGSKSSSACLFLMLLV